MNITVVKIGGNVIDSPVALAAFLSDFVKLKGQKILVHGGGKLATQLSDKLGVESKFVDGRRITSPAMLDIAVMTYAGLINKKIVAALQASGCNAIGLSGADGMAITAHKRQKDFIDYGEVGDVEAVNASMLKMLIQNEYTPVICAISCDTGGNLLNTNADTIASAVASAVASFADTSLIYCFEKRGVLLDMDDDDSVIARIDPDCFDELKSNGIIASGMIPKISNSLYAVTHGGVNKVIIKSSNELLLNTGTLICR